MRPLYELGDIRPTFDSARSNAGLWFDKFCEVDEKAIGLSECETVAQWKAAWIGQAAKKIGDRELLKEITERRAALAAALGGRTLWLRTTSRFVTGLARAHPVENGFGWHHAYGVPYLPGSSIKGALRAMLKDAPGEEAEAGERILGSAKSGEGTVRFLDALPPKPVKLEADVLTPHYRGWYREGKAPGDWDDPTPIPFLTVAPEQDFVLTLTAAGAGADTDLDRVVSWVGEVVENWGLGAKTAVGYGRFLAAQDETALSDRWRELERAAASDQGEGGEPEDVLCRGAKVYAYGEPAVIMSLSEAGTACIRFDDGEEEEVEFAELKPRT